MSIAEIVFAWVSGLTFLGFWIALILVYTLKDEQAKIAGYVMYGCIGTSLVCFFGWILSGGKSEPSVTNQNQSPSPPPPTSQK